MANIIMKITDYVAHLWHNTAEDIVMAENVNGWEDTLQQHSQFLKRFSWQPSTAYPKNSVLLYPFGLHTKLVSKNAGTSGNNEPTWSAASGTPGSRTIQDNNIVWEEQPIQISADTTPIGTIKQQLWNVAPAGYLKLDKSVILNRREYPELWSFVQSNMPLTTEVQWQTMLTRNKSSVPYFSQGDGSTTFRTPILMDFSRGGSTAGGYFQDQNKAHNHAGSVASTSLTGRFIGANIPGRDGGYISGVFSRTGIWAGACAHKSDTREVVNFNGTHSHSLTLNSSGSAEAFPKHFIMPYYLRTLNI